MANKGMASRVHINLELMEQVAIATNRFTDDTSIALQNALRLLKQMEDEGIAGGQSEQFMEYFRTMTAKINALKEANEVIKKVNNDKLMKSIEIQKDHGATAATDTLRNARNAKDIRRV